MLHAARNLLASRGVPRSVEAMAGAWDEIEHRRKVDALIDGLCQAGSKPKRGR